MLLTISTTHSPATDLGYLLHKHPDRIQSFDLNYGKCHVFFPEASQERCTVSLVLDVDPVGMARGKHRKSNFALAGYVNDRPFVASSFMSTTISKVFGTALSGACKQRPELASQPIPLEVTISALPVRGGRDLIQRIFEPLGYKVSVENELLDDQFPDWGKSPYFSVTLSSQTTLSQLLNHLYVLIPVFDNQKHYFTGPDELEKLLSKGADWLPSHPEREFIARRYLKFQSGLFHQAMAQLEAVDSEDENGDLDSASGSSSTGGPASANDSSTGVKLEQRIKLHDSRLDFVCEKLVQSGATSVIDLGCGEGKLLRRLIKQWQFKLIVGTDVAVRSLEIASKRLRLDELPSFQAERVKLIHSSLMYRDSRFENYDAAAVVEVIEHLDPPRLSAFERVVFRHARPATVVVTTPNSEYNVMWPSLPAGKFRHPDHRFEWTRNEFETWGNAIGENYGYRVQFLPVGPVEESFGAPTQMAIFQIISQVEMAEKIQLKAEAGKGTS